MTGSQTEPRGKAITVMIVDDHPTVREGLTYRISAEPDMRVCGDAADVEEALRMVAEMDPDVVVVDICLKSSDGLELIKELQLRNAAVKTLVHSMYDESLYADRCLRAGALGYLSKQAKPTEVVEAIRQLAAGRVYLNRETASELLTRRTGPRPGWQAEPIGSLSDRQLEVFRLLGEGLTAAQIASRLGISVHTVETHREKLKQKLNAKTLSELNRRAVHWVMENR